MSSASSDGSSAPAAPAGASPTLSDDADDRWPGRPRGRDDAQSGALGTRGPEAERRDRAAHDADQLAHGAPPHLPAPDHPRRRRARRVARDRLPRARDLRELRGAGRRRGREGRSRDRDLARRRSSSRSRSRSASRSCSSRSRRRCSRSWLPIETNGSFVIVEGLIRVSIFILYLVVISLLPDLRRVFQYHGAEHKAINALEAGEELTPENVQRYSLIHPRCGTAFLLWVMVIAIFVFAFVGQTVVVLADREPHPAAAADRGARLRADPLRRQALGQPHPDDAARSGPLAPAAHDARALARPARGLDPRAARGASARGSGAPRGEAARRSHGLRAMALDELIDDLDALPRDAGADVRPVGLQRPPRGGGDRPPAEGARGPVPARAGVAAGPRRPRRGAGRRRPPRARARARGAPGSQSRRSSSSRSSRPTPPTART